MSKRGFVSNENNFRKSVYILGTVLILSICMFAIIFMLYTKNLSENAKEGLLATTTNDLVPNDSLELLDVSTSEDKNIIDTINTVINESTEDNGIQNISKAENKIVSENKTANEEKEKIENKINEKSNTENMEVESNSNVEGENIVTSEEVQEEKIEKFIAPVSGDIIKDYADETLIYSETLKEWTSHLGIDIRAEKTSIVQCAAKGVVESIKNDPRYGLTVTIAHAGNFKTVYSNLLTAEFITEGEAVEEGQTIATIGNTAAFEVADESHLHFEILKDNQPVNPTMYLK